MSCEINLNLKKMSTGSKRFVLIPLWLGQGIDWHLLLRQWERTETGLAARPCCTTGVGRVLTHAHYVVLSPWPLPMLAPSIEWGYSVPTWASGHCCAWGASAAHTSGWILDSFLPWELDPAPATPAAEWNSAALGQLPWNCAISSLSGTHGIWTPPVGC